MRVIPQGIPDLLLIEPEVFGDPRGFFFESWNHAKYAAAGLPQTFVQDNISLSRRGILRGLHAQNPRSQGKLVQVLQGEVFDVAVDIRKGSPTFGQWRGLSLSAQNKRQLWIPPGFAHGFFVVSDTALFHYKCTDCYSPGDEFTLLWNDPDVGIAWPEGTPILSAKDEKGLRLKDIPAAKLEFQTHP
ncbi:MAG: dTDP-4-dehydrorhamnose 3,5-epimerase [Verrucomicrobia bacterium]|jgi:dTDP-4-dehydrorhamnose 3,5-epimerase|nr:dTDP-4-dehydrorhamnose 3,5-epimerase [Verrucomicrobiota bacterium]